MSLYMKLGTVQSRKTANMLMTIYEYESTNKPVLVIKPARDTRNIGFITTRAGIEKRVCETFHDERELLKLIEPIGDRTTIFIDEVQFCSPAECELIKAVSQKYNILCYGLLSDYTGRTFDAISNLIAEMPSIEWIKSMCCFCDSAAKMNLRMINGVPLYRGNPILPENEIGKDEYFKVCVKCYHNPPLEGKFMKLVDYDVEDTVKYQCVCCGSTCEFNFDYWVRINNNSIPDSIYCSDCEVDKIGG